MSETTMVKKEDTQIEPSRQMRSIVPEVDILENEEEILLYADLPGVIRENLTVQVDNESVEKALSKETFFLNLMSFTCHIEYHR